MSKPIGAAKTGGRKKGTPNKKTLGLEEALAIHSLDVIGQLAEVLPQLEAEKKASILMDLLNYIYPKRKSVEMNGVATHHHNSQVTIAPPDERPEAIKAEEARTRFNDVIRRMRLVEGNNDPQGIDYATATIIQVKK